MAALLLAPAVHGQFAVTTAADSGPGSLRQAILDANAAPPCGPNADFLTIRFPQPGLRIELLTPLPVISPACGLILGGDFDDVTVATISGPGDGLRIQNSKFVIVQALEIREFDGNGIVSTDSELISLRGVTVRDNAIHGIVIADTVVSSISDLGSSGKRTLVSGNGGNGVLARNVWGLDITHSDIAANDANGIHLHDVSDPLLQGTKVQRNGHTGILITGSMSNARLPMQPPASVAFNGLLGIDIGADGVSASGTPIIESAYSNGEAIHLAVRAEAPPGTLVRFRLYGSSAEDPSGYGEGERPLADLHTIADGYSIASVKTLLQSSDVPRYVTAIAMTTAGPTEFSRATEIVTIDPTFTVTTTADSGPGSLRQAITDLNASPLCERRFPCTIAFNIPTENDTVVTIAPLTALPPITPTGVFVRGSTQTAFGGNTNPLGPEVAINGALCRECDGLYFRPLVAARDRADLVIEELIVNGFEGNGITMIGRIPAEGVVFAEILRCYIGTDAFGSRPVPNGRGIHLDDAYARIRNNIVSGNRSDGIAARFTFGGVEIDSNIIGADRTGFVPLANGGHGVTVAGGASMERNLIAFNGRAGVSIRGHEQMFAVSTLLSNIIHSNRGLGIDFGAEGVDAAGGDDFLPVIDVINARTDGKETTITYRAPVVDASDVSSSFRVEFFAASFADATGYGEARMKVGETHVRDLQPTVHELIVPRSLAGKYVSAVVTLWGGFGDQPLESSEFSRAVQVTSDGCLTTAPVIVHASTDARSTTVQWSSLPGATEYRIWFMAPGDEPKIAYRGSDTQASATLPRGSEYWIEARFDPCYGTQSEHRFVGP